jgi:transitional endoplasmic reticulum ATPase
MDTKLVYAMLSFLDDELYRRADMYDGDDDDIDSTTASVEKLRLWGDAMSRMTRIDVSLWDFVGREIHDEAIAVELERERERERERRREAEEEEDDYDEEDADDMGESVGYGGEMSLDFLNGERSTRIMTSNHSIADADCCENDDSNERVVNDDGGLREAILSSASVEEAVEKFARWNVSSSNCSLGRNNSTSVIMTSVLLLGDEGCGKTHSLDSIQRHYSSSASSSSSSDSDSCSSTGIEIIRPDRVGDMMGNSIGSTEDRIVALFSHTLVRAHGGRKCLIMLDDVDRMFSLSDDVDVDGADAQYHVGRRCKALFTTILDAVRGLRSSSFASAGTDEGHVLLLCTARSPCGEVADRFNRVLRMGLPDDARRRAMILSCLSPGSSDCGVVVVGGDASEDEKNDVVGSMVSLVARHSVGKSACELAHCCREVMLRCAGLASPGRKVSASDVLKRRLHCLDEILKSVIPLSLRVGSLDGVVDVRVFTPEELLSQLTTDKNGDVIMHLLGKEAERAYSALMNVVITPLCRSDEIKALLYGAGGREYNDRGAIDTRPIRVGALLAGAPGVGKTSLAYHCAAMAAKIARASLLDVSATSLIHKEIGGSERAVRSLFAAVRAAAPCVLLIDGIESVAPLRGNDTTTEGTMDRVLSTFLTEMDGIDDGGDDGACGGNVAVIGITHRPDMIDPALLRPGRLEKTITLGALDYEARRKIVARQIEDVTFDFASAGYFDPKNKDEMLSYIAAETAGMSAVEVIAICREASMVCLRELNFATMTKTKPSLTYNHFQHAITILKGKAGS